MKQPILRPLFAALLVALLQTGFLAYTIESHAFILRSGTDVVLKTAPVDPRDLLRGDYVVLSYDISRIPAEKFTGGPPQTPIEGALLVRLSPQTDGFWGVTEASFGALQPLEGTVIAKTMPVSFIPSPDRTPINVSYGIERFYVPEGKGKSLEEARNAQALSVSARVDGNGRMQIRLLSLDGKPLYEEPPY